MLIDKSIVFDFEGFAPSFGQAGIPKPHFVGVYDLSKQGEAKYCWYAFQPEWKPAVNGSRSPAELTVLAECFQHLLAQGKKATKELWEAQKVWHDSGSGRPPGQLMHRVRDAATYSWPCVKHSPMTPTQRRLWPCALLMVIICRGATT